MKFAWKALLTLGLLLILGAFAMDTTVGYGSGRVHNIGLQNQQQMLLILGCVLFLAGIVIFAVVQLKEPLQKDLGLEPMRNSHTPIPTGLSKLIDETKDFWNSAHHDDMDKKRE